MMHALDVLHPINFDNMPCQFDQNQPRVDRVVSQSEIGHTHEGWWNHVE